MGERADALVKLKAMLDSGGLTWPMRLGGEAVNLPAFVVNRGGEYCFVPSLSALRWLSELDR